MKHYNHLIKEISTSVYNLINEAFDFNSAVQSDEDEFIPGSVDIIATINENFIPNLFRQYGISLPKGKIISTAAGYIFKKHGVSPLISANSPLIKSMYVSGKFMNCTGTYDSWYLKRTASDDAQA